MGRRCDDDGPMDGARLRRTFMCELIYPYADVGANCFAGHRHGDVGIYARDDHSVGHYLEVGRRYRLDSRQPERYQLGSPDQFVAGAEPVNTATNTAYVFTMSNLTSWKIATMMESAKYITNGPNDVETGDGGQSIYAYEQGSK